jgi:ribosome biogenesis GTPase
MPNRRLEDWGWDDGWAALVAGHEGAGLGQNADHVDGAEHDKGAEPARVISQDRDLWTVAGAGGEGPARLTSGRRVRPFPAVGDWVLVAPGPSPSDPLSIVGVLPRRSAFARGAAGTGGGTQTVAANVDRVWIVHGLDVAPNLRKIERYLALAWESGAIPEVVLTKADLARDSGPDAGGATADEAMAEVEAVAFGVTVRVASVVDGTGIEALAASLEPGTTVALLGPSGVGKSSLVNRLAEAELTATGAVREADRKGRHVTTRRQLFRLPSGALLLDTPGMRELQVGALDDGLDRAFPEIEALAAGCRFRDCAHETEPECAVLDAVADGSLEPERLASWRKLRAEAEAERRRTDPQARSEAVSEYKSIMKSMKHHPKYRDR